MLIRLLSAALAAGFLAAVVATGLELALTSPLIIAAERFETRAALDAAPVALADRPPIVLAHAHEGHAHEDGEAHGAAPEWQPGEGLPRMLFTGLATLVGGIGYALLLGAVMLACGRAPTPERGLAFAVAGFLSVALAPALGLPPEAIGFENHRPTCFSAGVPFTFVPLHSLEAAGQVRPDAASWNETFAEVGAVYLYTRETQDPDASFHARMFAPGEGMGEDPATGSAAAALAGVIQHFDDLSPGEHLIRIEQGLEMGRPSLIELTMTIEGVRLAAAAIGGAAVMVRSGTLDD